MTKISSKTRIVKGMDGDNHCLYHTKNGCKDVERA